MRVGSDENLEIKKGQNNSQNILKFEVYLMPFYLK